MPPGGVNVVTCLLAIGLGCDSIFRGDIVRGGVQVAVGLKHFSAAAAVELDTTLFSLGFTVLSFCSITKPIIRTGPFTGGADIITPFLN